ncbi:MAG: hypothetical protein JWP92_3737 [Caulobacter sp.]|nr:hypothetical protein [Caulobacter sp.]
MVDTYVEGVTGDELVFKFGNDAEPAAFTAACSVNTERKIEFTSEVIESMRANCTDPKKPGRRSRRVKSTDIKFTGSGVADKASANLLVALQQAGLPFPGKVIQALADGFTITGKWVIESLSMGGTAQEDQTFDISLAIADADYTLVFD